MSDDFSRQVLRIVVGKLCQPLGVHGMQTSVCETLTDVLKNYLLTLGKTTASYCGHGECEGYNTHTHTQCKDLVHWGQHVLN